MGSSSAVTPEALLESLMNDGTIDAIRSKIINQLKANEELKNSTISMVEQSKVLNTPGAEKQTKRELFDALRRELESKVLEKASKSVWELILDNDGLGKEISETVERVYCRLGGRELPVLPPINGNTSSEKDKENSNSSSRKRSFSAMNMQGADEVVNKPRSTPAVPEDSVIKKIVPQSDFGNILSELKMYHSKDRKIFGEPASEFLDKSHPRLWWDMCGVNLLLLRSVAVKILSQPCSVFACERIWSAFDATYTKKRNRLQPENLQDSVCEDEVTYAEDKLNQRNKR